MLEQFLKDPDRVGAMVLLIIAVVGFFRGWVLSGAAHALAMKEAQTRYDAMLKECSDREERMRRERDEFKEMAIRGLELTRRSIDVAQKVKDA